jgi:hypothetical protein
VTQPAVIFNLTIQIAHDTFTKLIPATTRKSHNRAGLSEGIPYAYFLLIYATIQEAIEHNMKAIRLESGAYNLKRRLGFKLEDNNHTVLSGAGLLFKILTRLV